jgi:amino acid transporter
MSYAFCAIGTTMSLAGAANPLANSVDLAVDVVTDEEQRTLLGAANGGPNIADAAEFKDKKKLLGTAMGVYFPCLQNILGVILFLRLPFITGQAGAPMATVIIILCASSTFLTAQSMSAIATNGKITEGGPYFLVSRNLGPEWGGAIGVLFYLGTSFASSLYILGAVEAFKDGFNVKSGMPFETQLYALVLCSTLVLVVSGGVKYVNMASSFFLVVMLVAIFCIICGVCLFSVGAWAGSQQPGAPTLEHGSIADNFAPHLSKGWTFRSLLALFYPSVTGIMAGANRSDVLKNPGQSIPVGTLSAIFTSTTIYIAFVWLFGSAFSNSTLIDDRIVITSAIGWPNRVLVNVGIIMSCVGAALQALTGAPRLLSAIAKDGLLPFLGVFAAKPGVEPQMALVCTWLIASLPCLSGNLDLVTPIVTLCFLAMYATMNFCCFMLSYLKEPTWRPMWNNSVPGVRRATALIGVFVCVMLMLITGTRETMMLLMMVYLLINTIQNNKVPVNWGDSMHGMRFQNAMAAMHRLHKGEEHPKNWKPRLLVLCKCDERDEGKPTTSDENLILFAAQMKKGRGMLMVRNIVLGELMRKCDGARDATMRLQDHIENLGAEGFAEVMVNQNLNDGLLCAVQGAGLGYMRPNCVVMGLPSAGTKTRGTKAPEHQEQLLKALLGCVALQKALVLIKGPFPSSSLVSGRPIDVWWLVHDSGLPLLLPFLLCRHEVWSGCKLRLFVLQLSDDNGESLKHSLESHLRELRILAEVNVVPVPWQAAEFCVLMGSEERSRQKTESTGIRFDRRRVQASGGRMGASARKKIATQLHQVISDKSSAASLIITNLPSIGSSRGQPTDTADIFNSIDRMVGNLGPVVMVYSAGADVLTAQG